MQKVHKKSKKHCIIFDFIKTREYEKLPVEDILRAISCEVTVPLADVQSIQLLAIIGPLLPVEVTNGSMTTFQNFEGICNPLYNVVFQLDSSQNALIVDVLEMYCKNCCMIYFTYTKRWDTNNWELLVQFSLAFITIQNGQLGILLPILS